MLKLEFDLAHDHRAIDDCHAALIASLVACAKPQRVLELGFGPGQSCRAILKALQYNGSSFEYDLVDNWIDFGGALPDVTKSDEFKVIRFISSTEREFVYGCLDKYDFIFSDADHHNTQCWFQRVYEEMLNPGGILLYHDVTTADFPNLYELVQDCRDLGLSYRVFNKNSREGERCDRGLLAIFKPDRRQCVRN